jgi:rhodanese-related sulfurtransferase
MPKTVQELLAEARKEIREVTVQEVNQFLQSERGVRVIDVRDDDEWRAGHLPGAEHVTRGMLEFRIGKAVPDREAEIVFY